MVSRCIRVVLVGAVGIEEKPQFLSLIVRWRCDRFFQQLLILLLIKSSTREIGWSANIRVMWITSSDKETRDHGYRACRVSTCWTWS